MFQPIDALQPERTEVNLLTSARPLDLPGVAIASEAERQLVEWLRERNESWTRQEINAEVRKIRNTQFQAWKSGVAARNLGTLEAKNKGTCGNVESDAPVNGGVYEFAPVRTDLPHGCDDVVEEDVWKREAEAKLEQALPFMVAREVWTGATSGNPSLQSTAIDVSSSASIEPVTAVSLAIMNYEECTQGAVGFVHVPSVLLSNLTEARFVTRHGNRLLTPQGHVVVPGPGYPQSPGAWGPNTEDDPEADPVYAEAGDGEAWIYVSSPVEFVGPFYNERQRTAADFHSPRQNSFITIPEAWWAYRFETTCVFAALAFIPT